MEKNNNIQHIRAFAIMAVVVIHCCQMDSYEQIVYRPFVNFAVAAFIFLSGFLTKVRDIGWGGQFCKKRILRVLIPYVIWTSIYFLINGHHGVRRYLFDVVFATAEPILYYILVYVQLVILTPLIFILIRSRIHLILWLISPLSIIVFKYLPLTGIVDFHPTMHLLWKDSFFPWFTYYLMGIMLGNSLLKIKLKTIWLTMLYIISIFGCMLEGSLWMENGDGQVSQVMLSSLLSSSLFILLSYKYITKCTERRQWIEKIGDCSFGIYLSHMLVIKLVGSYMNEYHLIFRSIFVIVISFIAVYTMSLVLKDRHSKWIGFQ